MASRKPAGPRKSKRAGSGKRKTTRSGLKREAAPAQPTARLPIVGLGASAGGLDPLQEFFQNFPPRPGIAFIVAQHMDPTRPSDMVEILSRRTSLTVVAGEDGMVVKPDTVYTITPGHYITVASGRLRLTLPEEPRGLRLPIDVLFSSLATVGERAMGVILSGNGADGSAGLRAIRNQGGTILAQDPETAEYDGMPRSAIATGQVDFILPPGKMAEVIMSVAVHGKATAAAGRGTVGSDGVAAILAVLHARRNVDFSGYKKGTLVRRIERRMSLRRVAGKHDYLRLLQDDPEEVNALFRDLLIPATRFFRDPESWVVLEREVLKRVVHEADRNTPIRIWVTGCATGEEAYSLAILLLEMKSALKKDVSIQIFASDLDQDTVNIARAGCYPETIAADVGPERLKRFFTRQDHHYVVNQSVRDPVVFAHQNLLADPPFSRLDLVCCRNVLIYLEPPMQQRVLEVVHFALKPGRFLLLGSSETVGANTDLFQPLHKRVRLFRRLGTVRPDRIRVPAMGRAGSRGVIESTGTPGIVRDKLALSHARQVVLERYAVATVILNHKLEILSFFGPTKDYLTQPSGALTTDLSAWIKEGARAKVKVAIQSALRKNRLQTVRGLRFRRGTRVVTATCTVEPLTGPPETDGLILISFRDNPTEVAVERPSMPDADEPLVHHLEQELKTARDELQTMVENLEDSNEEMRVTNEELLSVNEELQSSNEELEISREELQSANEELSTVNAQLESKVFQLQGANEDIANLLTSTQIPTLFLDQHLTIRRYTPNITQLFRLIPSDVGRPIEDIAQRADDPTLLEAARLVQQQQEQQEREITTHKGKVYIRRVLPFRTGEGRVEGVVVTYIDLSERVRADASIREARDYFEAIVATLREPMLVLDRQLLVVTANRAFYDAYGQLGEEVIGRRIFDLGDREWDTPDFRKPLEELASHGTTILNLEIHREFAGLGERFICVNGTNLAKAGHSVILLSLEDITATVKAERARNETLRQLVSYEEKERHRLALDLHDETGQYVTAFLLGLASLRASASDPTGHALIGELQERAEELARHLHGISLQLRPTALDDHGLELALHNYAEAVGQRSGLDVDVQARLGGRRLPEYIETVLYRVTQEGLTNVLKHSSASKVSVILTRKGKQASLIIEDNGQGFDSNRVLGDGGTGTIGLRGMQERVTLAGGILTVESSPGAGTTLFVRMPIGEDHDER